MQTYIVAYIATAVVFLGLDAIWLGKVAASFYRSQIGELLADKPNFVAAGLFYLLYIAGVVYFAVIPGVQKASLLTALGSGAFLGLVAYGTYDFTNMATLKVWSTTLTVTDLAWGTFLTGISAAAGYWAVSLVKGA